MEVETSPSGIPSKSNSMSASESIATPVRPPLEQVAEARVRLLGRGEARVLADRPGPAAVHVRVGTARVRELARQLELETRDVLLGVDRFDLDPGVGLAAVFSGRHRERWYAVTIKVRLFAGLRERAGYSERELEGVRQVADVWSALDLGDEPEGLLYAVNREYADPGRELADGDEVALIPPVSGGAFRVTEEPLSLQAVVAEVADERAGGIATFTGTVRRRSRGREVTHLEYEAYAEMAEDVMAQIAAELLERHELCAVA